MTTEISGRDLAQSCREIVTAVLDGKNSVLAAEQLREIATRWAREGVPIEFVQRSVHAELRAGWAAEHSAEINSRAADPGSAKRLMTRAATTMSAVELISSAITVAYVREVQSPDSGQSSAAGRLASALLAGLATATLSREFGLEVADSYWVLALAITPPARDSHPTLTIDTSEPRSPGLIEIALRKLCEDTTLSELSHAGGTVLIPTTEAQTRDLAQLVTQLAVAIGAPITAVAMTAVAQDLPTAADQAHQLLEMACRLGFGPKVYQFDDLILEFQITRPGPGREFLSSILDALDTHPHLLDTLRLHVANNLNRQRTARLLHVHTNTVDHRLKRIAQMTGFDPTQATGLSYLRSALLARTYRLL